MIHWLKRGAVALAALFFFAMAFNSPLFAPAPKGYARLIAHRGMMQQFDHRGLGNTDCTARRIEPPLTDYLENSLRAIQVARRFGAAMIEIDVTPTADGKFALFHDAGLDCRTDGHGPTAAQSLAALQALDAGYGYSADGGKTFPLRGQGQKIASLEDGLAAAANTALLYNFKSSDPAAGERLIAAIKASGRNVIVRRDGFSVPDAQLARFRAAFPGAWVYSDDAIKVCTKGYLLQGWLGIVPQACRGGTIVVPVNRAWLFPGWPDRLIDRMERAGTQVMVIGPYADNVKPAGLDLPEQLRQVPADFNGYVWVDDIWTIGPALHPALNKRNPREEDETRAALESRRKVRGLD